MHFAVLPDERAARHPDAPAVADEQSGQLTNAQFLERVRSAAHRLASAGVGAGDVVAVRLPNRVELIVVLFAAWRLGAAATPVNPALTAGEVGYQLTDASARVLVCEDDATAAADRPVLTQADLAEPVDTAATPTADLSEAALALLIYTSGATGRPKGVELTHANLTAMTRSIIGFTGMGSDAHSLLILPLFHVNGIVVSVLTPLLAGGQTTVAGRFNPATFFDIVERVRPTTFSAVPTIYGMLVGLPADVVPDTGSLRYAICGAAPMPVELIQQFEGRYGVSIVEGCGLSEVTCSSTCNPIDGTVGVPLPGVQVAVMDARGCVTPDDLLAHLGAVLAKLPAEIVVVDEVPRNPIGKFDKPALRRRLTMSIN